MHKALDIIFVSHHSNLIGGGEISLLGLMRGLANAGHKITLLVPGAGWLSQQAEQSGIEVIHLSMPKIGPKSIAALWRWYQYLRIRCPDILHANTPRAAFYAGLTGRLLGIPMLFHCRVSWPDRRMDPLLIRLAHAVITNSQATARRFEKWPHVRLQVVYNGISLPPELPADNTEKPYGAEQLLLCVARVSRWKRHDVVLDVFTTLAEQFPGLHLVCVGGQDDDDAAWWEEMQIKSRALSCADRIHWIGQDDDVTPWYQTADVLVLASRNEPFGRVLVEAMAHGVPVVAFDSGGVPEILQDARQGYLIPEGNTAQMAASLGKLLQDEALRQQMGKEGRKQARAFSIPAHVDAVCRLYREMHGR